MLWPVAGRLAVATTASTVVAASSSSSTSFFSFFSSTPPSFLRLLSCRHGSIVNLAVVLHLVAATLPPGAEDEIVLIEHLPGRQVHLQDFFWTGVEDAPPWLSNDQLLTLYETRTVHHHHHTATVYVPDDTATRSSESVPPRPVDCASCPIEPTPTLLHDVNQDVGILIGDDPGPRFWLLTVLKAGETVPPKIELRLARLYKAAFTRQQQRHLGLLPEYRLQKSFPKRQIPSENDTLVALTTESSASTAPAIRNPSIRIGRSLLHMRPVRIAPSRHPLPLIDGGEFPASSLNVAAASSSSLVSANDTNKPKQRSSVDIGLVQVRMQNTSFTETGATRLIYTVHLGGKPVPAETAAKDMALLSAQEVALELGAPVIIQSEPYLKESRPLALSRRRDAWLLISAAGVGFLLLAIVLATLFVFTKRKRAQSAVSAPPTRRILAKDVEEYAPTTPGIDNTAYTSETEARTEATSGRKRTTPGTLSRTPGSQDTLEADQRDAMVSENELEAEQQRRGLQPARLWDTREYLEASKKGISSRRTVQQLNIIDRPRSMESADSAVGGEGRLESLESLEKGFGGGGSATAEEAMGSPHSYLSMPSCKQFPNMRSVEPLSKVLEPVIVKHLDLELDSPEMKMKSYDYVKENGDFYFTRSSSETKDPGVLGPIVWDLRKKKAAEGDSVAPSATAAQPDLESRRVATGTLGQTRHRLNGFIEDSFGVFGGRDSKRPSRDEQQQQQYQLPTQQRTYGEGAHQDRFTLLAESRGRSAHVSPVGTPNSAGKSRPRTSLPRNGETDLSIPETGRLGPHPRGAWGSRPLSAGPFHRPNLPEVEVERVLADSQLRPEDPAVPLITSIRKELGKYSYD